MNRAILSSLNYHLRQIFSFFLALIAVSVFSFPALANDLAGHNRLITPEDSREQVDSTTVNEIQKRAEDFGGEKIGDTGLKNIRKLGENIPETIEQNFRQRFGDEEDSLQEQKARGEV
ncbi:hypothetical protein [Lyngbya aestuarii]|uniref:hypothetical protein n=1 Tax=Lyngbya aestuarii TaxID=118322 RepID=UPI00403DBBD5